MVSRFAASAIARPLFSIASHPPYTPASGLTEAVASASFFTPAGSCVCAEKITFELGNRIPRMTCSRLAWTCCGADRAGPRAGGAAAPRPCGGVCADTISTQSTAKPMMISVTNVGVRIFIRAPAAGLARPALQQRFHLPFGIVDERAVGFHRQRSLRVRTGDNEESFFFVPVRPRHGAFEGRLASVSRQRKQFSGLR